ncbi:DUF2795 domain-containing protein [Streptomyces hawaiiensis]|uniref:DUF2795 domain-containing protein n=1 Tax=Streptomyces hawaiiensis TaxID=67305 RepID=UPI00365519DB
MPPPAARCPSPRPSRASRSSSRRAAAVTAWNWRDVTPAARHLDRTAFPADRRSVLDVLAAHHAPGPVLEAARRLPDSGSYANVTEIVEALGDALGTGQQTG